MIALVLFDLDGTLVDSHRDITTAVNRTLVELGWPPRSPDEVKGMIGHGVRDLLAKAMATEDAALLDRGRSVFGGYYAACLTDTTRPYAGIPELLEELRARGVPAAIATNKPSRFTREVVARIPVLRDGVRAAASADEAGAQKPDPAVLRLAQSRAGVEAPALDLVYVGDMAVDIATARAFGCRSLGAGWGFSSAAVAAAGPDAFAATPAEARRWLLEWAERR